jgi:uncharacterized delta-60 repeat protein
MKKFFSLLVMIPSLYLFSYSQPGSLDPSFGINGRIATPITGISTDRGKGMAIQSDGKIVVVGSTWNGSSFDFGIVRYNTDGTLDLSFGGDGKVSTEFGISHDEAKAVAIQSDGKIVVVGSSLSGNLNHFALCRYNIDGSLDFSFDNDGKLITIIGTSGVANSVVIQNDNKIVVIGGSYPGSIGYNYAIVRYNSNGTLDNSFDSDGIATTDFGGDDFANCATIQNDGKILVAGRSGFGAFYNFSIARYNTNGTLDPSFSIDGKVTTDMGNDFDIAFSMVLQIDGKILLAGRGGSAGEIDFAIARYNSDGNLDETFDSDGKIFTSFGDNDDEANSVTLQTDGKILVAGYSSNVNNNDFALIRYNPDGTSDATFGDNGKVLTDFANSNDQGFAITISGFRIYVAGFSDNKFAVAAYLIGSLPDLSPPNITDGPNASQITCNSATITLATDEGSSTYVSYNDGIHYFNQNDPNFVTVHSIALTGLSPGTTYFYRVSFTDPSGNGPVLSNELSFTTLSGIEVCNGLDDDCDGQIDEGFTPTISIETNTPAICGNPDVHFTANVTNQGTSPYYQWKLNGVVIDAGSQPFTDFANLKNGDVITCELTSSLACVTQANVTSNTIIITVEKPNIYYGDADGDGYGNPSNSISSCTQPEGYVTDNTDCDDAQFFNHPGASEICDGLDNNCDGQRDEGVVKTIYYQDADGDGYGNPESTTQACSIVPRGFVSNNTDCNDDNALIHPDATELCNGIDDNCDGEIDEGIIKPTGSITGTQTICEGQQAEFTFNLTGTPPFDIVATDQFGSSIAVNGIAGYTLTRSWSLNNVSSSRTFKLTSVTDANCSAQAQDMTGAAVVTINPRPTGTISGTQTICEGQQAEFTFNLTGTPPFDIIATDQFGSSIAVNGIAGYTLTRSWSLNNVSSSRTFKLTSITDANCSAQAQDMMEAAVVTIGDALPPDVHTKNLIVSLDAEGHASITSAQIDSGSTDNCTRAEDLQLILDKTSFDCTNKGSNIVSLTVADANGNTSSKTAIVIVTDNTKPYVKTAPQSLIVNTDAGKCTASNVFLGFPEFSDNCPGTIATTNAPAIFTKGVTIVTWTATDVAGNTATALQTITVVDNEKPVITFCPTIPIQCYNANGTYTVPALTAIDNCGVQSISYAISGATSRSGNNNDASGIFNPGSSTITWSVADTSGNVTNCTTTVKIDKVDASIPDVYPNNITPAIGNPNTIYIGYGGSSVTLSAQVTSSLIPNSFTYKWTLGSHSGTNVGTGQTITVSPTATTVYYLSIKDANSCKPLYQVTKQINVVNILCGSGKITACVPQKNGTRLISCISSSTNTINKLAAGWYLGQCSASAIETRIVTATTNLNTDQTFNQKVIDSLEVTVAPNPSSYHFTLVIKSNSRETLSLRVADAIGRPIERRSGIAPNSTLQLGHVYRPGTYIVEIVQGNQRRYLKLVKGSQ